MDELPNDLVRLIEDARGAHDPSAEDARRVGLALGAVLPGLAAGSLLTQSVASAASGSLSGSVAGSVSQGAQAAALKGAWFGSLGGAKLVGAMMAVTVAATAVTVTQLAPERSPSATHVATRSARPVRAVKARAVEPVVAPVAPAAPVVGPATPAPSELGVVAAPTAPRATPPLDGAAAPGREGRAAELDLIERALRALHQGNPALADRLLRRHAARFPHGNLAQEREGLTLIALCQQGRAVEAAELRERFLKAAAGSPLAARVERACR